jgi:GNAT superfamily N-acetyltransferase
MSNFTIRAAHTADASVLQELLCQLEHPLSQAEVLEKINQYNLPQYHLLVIEVDSTVVGLASLHWYDVFYDVGYIGRITAFCVDQKFRSKGIGQKLLQAAEDYFLQHQCIRIEVSSNERRAGAHRFYLANGFTINSKRFIKHLIK